MEHLEPLERELEDQALPLSPCMKMTPNLFRFAFEPVSEILNSLDGAKDLSVILEDVAAFLRDSDLPAEEVEIIADRLSEEMEVIAFARAARISVISL